MKESKKIEEGLTSVTKVEDNIALGFRDFSVTTRNPFKALIYGATGYVEKGGITAIMGASAAGKSVLLQALSSRTPDLVLSGTVTMDGAIVDPFRADNPVALVPQEDSLMGELTAREVTLNSAVLKRKEPISKLKADVDTLIDGLGLTHVADGIIGTLIFRGLSGGQKKRVEISTELIASPSILLLDEPTSGLDSSIAYEVLRTIRELVKNSEGKLSVILTIHQPNSQILGLFDHLLILDQGTTLFFGTVPQSLTYFARIGFPCPEGVTPTDYFLQITDSNFNYAEDYDFEQSYRVSPEGMENERLMEEHTKFCAASGKSNNSVAIKNEVSFFMQVYTLIYREYALAYRDPTLYYFQVALLVSFSFLTGCVFFSLRQVIDQYLPTFPGSLVWLTYFFTWIHIFKVYYISKQDKRTRHEIANDKYSAAAFLTADFFVTASLGCIFFIIIPIAYFMIGFPGDGIPKLFLFCWMTSLAGEAQINFLTKFSDNPTTSMIQAQIFLVSLLVFGGGIFIPWNDCPDYWIWLQETTVFTQSSRVIQMEVFSHMDFTCYLDSMNKCISDGSGIEYPCSTFFVINNQNVCSVTGRDFLFVSQGIGTEDDLWYYFGYLCAIFVGYKIGVIILTYYPWGRIMNGFRNLNAPDEETHNRLLQESHQSSRKNLNDSRHARAASKGKNVGSESTDQLKTVNTTDIENFNDVGESTVKEDAIMPVKPKLTKPVSFRSESSALCWTDLSVILPKSGAKLIDNVSGVVRSGRVLALMGPSGAGKTTLLNGLAKRAKYAQVTGNVLFAGRNMTSSDLTYVPQFDELNHILTVKEHMYLVGQLTCTDYNEMAERAEKLMEVLGLDEKKNVQVKDLSGGEKKRVSVGVGMVSNPNVLFLDEPTTGLDSTAAFSIVQYLVEVAKSTQVAVIMTIHQPSALVFSMLDDLLLLETGRIVYAGSIEDAKEHFASVGCPNADGINPADYYLDQAQHPPKEGSAYDTWTELFLHSECKKVFDKDLHDAVTASAGKAFPSTPNAFVQYGIMFKYFMHYFNAERGFYWYRLAALIIIGVFVGTLYLDLNPETSEIQNYVGAMFFSAIAVMLTAISSTAIFAMDRREAVDRVNNGMYNPGVFVLAQFSASAIFNIIVVGIFVCLFHWLTDLNPDAEAFFYDWLINWGHLMVMEGLLMTVIEVLKNDFLCTTFGLVFLGSCMAFAGFFRAVSDIPPWANWMCYILPLKWSFDGFIYQVFHSQSFLVTGSNPAVHVSGDQVLSSVFNNNDTSPWGLWAALIGYVLLFRLTQYTLFAYQTDKLPKFCGMSMTKVATTSEQTNQYEKVTIVE